jgi:hypothetical protein
VPLLQAAQAEGMGGVGETSLAIEYAHRFRGLCAGVCWCPAETRTGLLSALAGLAVTLGATTAEETDVEKAARAAPRRLAEQRATWRLVLRYRPGSVTRTFSTRCAIPSWRRIGSRFLAIKSAKQPSRKRLHQDRQEQSQEKISSERGDVHASDGRAKSSLACTKRPTGPTPPR